MKTRRLMKIQYRNDADAERLKTCLDMICVPYVAYREYEFVGGGALWNFYIDRKGLTWEQIMREVNRVHAVPFGFISNCYIENGKLYG